MELMGEEVSQRGRRGPPFILKGPIQLLPPKQPHRGRYYCKGQRYYRWTRWYYRSPLRYYRPAREGLKIEEGLCPAWYCRGGRAVLPLSSGTTATTTAVSAAQPDTRSAPLESRR